MNNFINKMLILQLMNINKSKKIETKFQYHSRNDYSILGKDEANNK